MKKKLGVDVDDVLCDFIPSFLKWYNIKHKTNHHPSIIRQYDFEKYLHISRDQTIKEIEAFYDSDIFHSMLPKKHSQEVLRILSHNYELICVTSRYPQTIDSTQKWVNDHYPTLIGEIHHTTYKGDLVKRLGITTHIDDAPHHINAISQLGIPVLAYDSHWNTSCRFPQNVKRVYGWRDIRRELK